MGCAFLAEGDNEAFFSCSYRSFGHFRRYVAKLLGFNLDEMEGFGGEKKWDSMQCIGHIYYLFSFADCEGTICADISQPMGRELQELLKNDIRHQELSAQPTWVKGKRMSYERSDMREQMDMFDKIGLFRYDVEKFILGLIRAGSQGKNIYIY